MILLIEVSFNPFQIPYKLYPSSKAKFSGLLFAGEVEDQLKLLQELVPEWISEKLASSGDVLLW